jgi:mannose-6-phosphate isomerase
MFVGLSNTPRDYAWGSTTAIAELLGRKASGRPEAEYWLGTHPGSPSVIQDPAAHGGATRLDELTTLPFLLKVLAANGPLSLQAHPTTAQAIEGFARENALGIPLDAPNRNYRDAGHKPELIFALSERFGALCGFRPVEATRALLSALGPDPTLDAFLVRLQDDTALRPVVEWLLTRTPDVEALIDRLVELAATATQPEFALLVELAGDYPRDPGIAISLLLNYVVLKPGEALYLPAGNIHMYLHGLGIELMAASDNVLRGGLTPKHVDVAELVAVLDFRPVPVPFLVPERPSPGLRIFRPDVPDFELVVVSPTDERVQFVPAGQSLLICTDGDVTVTGAVSRLELARGDSAWCTADEGALEFTGTGTVFLAAANPEAAAAARA